MAELIDGGVASETISRILLRTSKLLWRKASDLLILKPMPILLSL
jgi:hypothetical protein